MKNLIQQEVLKVKDIADHTVLDQFLRQLNSGKGLSKQSNPTDHFCAFFIPIDRKKKTMFLGHHIKANSWIPPGGHIDEGENPIQTIKREFKEELQHTLTTEKIELFTLSIIHIDNPKFTCKTHYDFWYLVFIDEQNFMYDKREFYDTKWVPLADIDTVVTHEVYIPLMKKLKQKLLKI